MLSTHYANLLMAIHYYRRRGYTELEVPWLVSNEACSITRPEDSRILSLSIEGERNQFVGSAEQSFLQLALDRTLKPGRYVSLTPCVRDEVPSPSHHTYFSKVELIDYRGFDPVEPTDACLKGIVATAFDFFYQRIGCEVTQTGPYEYDIVSQYAKIELGSYGIRQHPDVGIWYYGTGCAEPRLSYAIEEERNLRAFH